MGMVVGGSEGGDHLISCLICEIRHHVNWMKDALSAYLL